MAVGHVSHVAPDSPGPEAAVARQGQEALWWLGLVAVGAAVTAALGLASVELGTNASPFSGRWAAPTPPRLSPAVLLPVVVAAVVLLANRSLTARPAGLRWPGLLLLSYVGTLAWTLSLAVMVRGSLDDTLAAPGDLLAAVAAVGDSPTAYLDGLTGPEVLPVGADPGHHPPGPVLLLWALTRLGVDGPVLLGLLLTALGAATVPLVLVATRSLCHDTAARRLAPVLVLAPWAAWTAASPQAVTAATAAVAVAVGVVGSEPGRRPWWALASGLLLGVTGLFGFPAPWLGTAVAATYFVRRRPLLNAVTGLGALVPLFAVSAVGFSWPESLGASRTAGLVGSTWQSWIAWTLLDLVVVVVAAGPVLVRAARRIRLTPGWPLLVGAGAAALFSLSAGLAHGGVERSWLVVLPWLAVPALAPRPRPVAPGDTVQAGDVPVLLVAVGAASAVALRLCLVPS